MYRFAEDVNFPVKNLFHRFSKYIDVFHYGHLHILAVSSMSPIKYTLFFRYIHVSFISFVFVGRLVYITGHAVV